MPEVHYLVDIIQSIPVEALSICEKYQITLPYFKTFCKENFRIFLCTVECKKKVVVPVALLRISEMSKPYDGVTKGLKNHSSGYIVC